MIPCHAVAAPATSRRSTLLAEALASRLAEQALCHRQRTSASATRRSPLRRSRELPTAPPEPLAITTACRRMAAHPVSTLTATPR
jgi:hypothetical protein